MSFTNKSVTLQWHAIAFVLMSVIAVANCKSADSVKTKKFIFAKRFEGLPKVTDFRLEEEVLPALKDNEVLFEGLWHSVDPYMRPFTDNIPTGVTMVGGQLAKVIQTKNANYPIGTLVYGSFGWQTHTIYNPNIKEEVGYFVPSYKLPSFDGLPTSLGLGHLGMPGITAYYGLMEFCNPKPNETVVISGAAGAVGSLVGQIAKLKGAHVIGIAGTEQKGDWLKNELNFDHTINYKTDSIDETLKKHAPNGVDCYFDNVGGEISSKIINQMNNFGRVPVCGSISSYNSSPADYPKASILQPAIVLKQLTIQGFLFSRFWDRWTEGIVQLKNWTLEGKLKYRETVWEGFEKMPEAFISMLQGGNTGKAVVKA